MESTLKTEINMPSAQTACDAAEPGLTKNMRRQFPYFSLGSLLYSAFYAFCLYKNASGITYPFFVAGTLCFFFFSMQKLGVPYKKDSVFSIVSIVLLGLSNCMTASPQLLFMNKCGIFCLTITLMLHTIYEDRTWDFSKYFSAIFHTIGACFGCLFRPFGDAISYFDARKQKERTKNRYIKPVLTGILLALPLLLLVTILLSEADAVFDHMIASVLDALTFTPPHLGELGEILFLMAVVFLFSYALFAALCKKSVKEKAEERSLFDPVIAIVATSLLGIVYLLFSVIQILYLFIGHMTLPEGYTYAEYAREGFFQLLAVCVINLILVLICLHLFRESKGLKAVLTVICGCTDIMILSSALRMVLYINTYALTFLRVFVLWALVVIFAFMTGVTIYIYNKRFPLFQYGVAVLTVCYLIFSFAHPDYWIARYDLRCVSESYKDCPAVYRTDKNYYLSNLSADAAPAILNPEINTDFTTAEDILEKTSLDENGSLDFDYADIWWMSDWMETVSGQTGKQNLFENARKFNFSVYWAKKHMNR